MIKAPFLKILIPQQMRPLIPHLWSRFFFFRFIRLTGSIILLSYTLFVIADMVGHLKDILDPKTSKKLWLTYYAAMFSRRFDILVPFSAGIAATLIFFRATHENIIIPLLSSGLSLRKFLLPFILGGFVYTTLSWINFEYCYPIALHKHLSIIDTDFGREKPKEDDTKKLGVIMLPHGERLFFKEHVKKKALLKDVFWVISRDKVCHIEELHYSIGEEKTPPRALRIEYYERDENSGDFSLSIMKTEEDLSSLSITGEQIAIATAQPREISLSDLYMITNSYGNSKTERANETKIALITKLMNPLLSIFAVLLAAFVSLHFDRRSVSLSRSLGILIAALFTTQVIIQATTALARSPFVPTTFILLLPWGILLYLTLRQVKRI